MFKHYTKQEFASALMRCVDFAPTCVFDPAVGGGALLKAAHSRWPNAVLRGVDICSDALEHAKVEVPSATFRCHDALNAKWLFRRRNVGPLLIVCNPPFSGQSHLQDVSRTDMQFLQKALNIVRKRDLILFVLPNSIAANPLFSSFRYTLLRQHRLIAAISLPENAFERTEAAAVAIVLQPETPTDNHLVRFIEIGSNASMVHQVRENVQTRSFRFDPSYYVRQKWVPAINAKTVTLACLVGDIRRGLYVEKTSTRSKNRQRFLHTTDLHSGWISQNDRRYVEGDITANVNRGCVLQSRVGNGLWRKSALFKEQAVATASDCIYLIRTPSLLDSAYLAASLTTTYMQASIRTLVRGITAPILNKAEFLELQIPWISTEFRKRIAQQWLLAKCPYSTLRITKSFNRYLLLS